MNKLPSFAAEKAVAARRKLPNALISLAREKGWQEETVAEASAALALVRPRLSPYLRNLLLQEQMSLVHPSKGLDELLRALAAAAGVESLSRAPVNGYKP